MYEYVIVPESKGSIRIGVIGPFEGETALIARSHAQRWWNFMLRSRRYGERYTKMKVRFVRLVPPASYYDGR